MRRLSVAILGMALVAGCRHEVRMAPGPDTLALPSLHEGQDVEGFTARAVYLDDANHPMGARFVHDHTGFELDYVRLESVPQGFVWVNTVPTSDRGEPHTQEHLLLGKGNKGRAVASMQDMWLVDSSAFTAQVHTCYDFDAPSGPGVFFDAFAAQLDALLHPDYTDEEIRREVHHFGIAKDPDGTLRLDEKGTVYNEMVSTSDRWWARLWRAMNLARWGPGHPYAFDSGGWPAALRTLQPAQIRAFHDAHYQLGNMGMIAALPPDVPLRDALHRIGATLDRLQPAPTPPGTRFETEDDLPPPHPAPAGEVQVVGYPSADANRPGEIVLAWPADLALDGQDRILLELFLDTLAGSEASPLYARLVDTKTRVLDLGATGVWAYRENRRGDPVLVGLDSVRASDLDPATVGKVRGVVRAELKTIAGWAPGDPALKAFDRLFRSELSVRRRAFRKMVNTPPRFGARNTGTAWMDLLDDLARDGGFDRSLTRRPDFDAIEAMLDAGGNPWAAKLKAWGLLDTQPYGFATRPDPKMLDAEHAALGARIAAETAKLREKYGVTGDQAALRRYQADYAAATAKLDAAAAHAPLPPLVAHPPMTLDDPLDFEGEVVSGTKIPAFAAHFASMSGATVSLALRLDGVPKDQWPYLAALPALVRRTGVHTDTLTLTNAEVLEQIQKEILSLRVWVDANYDTGRQELVITGSGTDLAESRKSLVWMARLLAHADWRPENLPRIRDLLDEVWSGLRDTTQGSEESWVQDPAQAWLHQDAGRLLVTESFMTRAYAVMRLRWELSDAGPATPQVAAFLRALGQQGASLDRAALGKRLDAVAAGTDPDVLALPEAGRPVAARFGSDLGRVLADIPDSSLSPDFTALCDEAAADLQRPPADVLAGLDRLRSELLQTWRARLVLVGSPDTLRALQPDLATLVGTLKTAPKPAITEPAAVPLVTTRLHERGVEGDPLFVGLVQPDLPSGVFVLSAAAPSEADTDRESLLRVLAGNTYTGHGAHSLFMKTWAAGLAYSNGVRPDVAHGRMLYYAERCPKLPQTLKFVIDTLKEAPVDDGIARYAIAQAFYSRAAGTYEGRAWAMAADLADGRTPQEVRAFREAILALRTDPDLPEELHQRMPVVYGDVLPGWGPPSAKVKGGSYFVIGPDAQLDAWAAYLRAAEGPEAPLVRLYPRDFWMTTP